MTDSGSQYFAKNFRSSNNVDYDAIKAALSPYIRSFPGKSKKKEIAQKIKEFCQENDIKLKTSQKYSSNRSTHTTRSSSSASGNVNITINESRGLTFWDYLLLQNLFGNKQQPIIINNAPAATRSAPQQQKKDKSEGNANVFIFLAAACIITHLAVCAIYQMYFKKEAEKPGKPIDYLVKRQFGIAIFQLAFGVASLIGGAACINQSEIFFPLLYA